MSVVFPIEDKSRYAKYTATAGQALFSIPFVFQQNRDVKIQMTLVGTSAPLPLVEVTDYSIAGAGAAAGGTFMLTTVAAEGDVIEVWGDAVLDRLGSIVQGGKFKATTHDNEHDRHRIIQQEQRAESNRAVKVDRGVTTPRLIGPFSAGDLLTFNSDLDLVPGINSSDIANAAGNAAAAASSAAAAAASAALAGAPFPSRVLAQAADVDPSLNEIKVIHAGEILTYVRDAAGAALTTNDGASWSPADLKTVKHYGAIGDGVADDSAAIQAAIDDANNSVLVFNAGGDFRVNTGLNVINIDVVILAYGATLIQGANVVSLSMSASTGTTTVAASLNNADAVDVSGGDAVTTPVASVTFGAAHSYVVGDIVKVVSDDVWEGGQAGQFWGEVGRVIATTANTIYLDKRFLTAPPSSPTNLRVCVLRQFKQELHGLTFDTDDAGDAANWLSPQFRATGLVNPRFRDLEVVRGWAVALEFRGCLEIDASGIAGGNLTNDPSNSRYGYLINDKSGQGNIWLNVNGRNCRHVYTTNQDSVVADSDLRFYGQSLGHLISNGVANRCSGTGWDTHADAVNVTFKNCVSMSDVRGAGALGSGYQLRGRGHAIRNCECYGSKYGIQILQQFATAATRDIVVDGFKSVTPFAGLLVNGQSGNLITGIKVRNSDMEVTDHNLIVQGSYCDIKMDGVQLKHTGAVANPRGLYAGAECTINVDKTTADFSESTGSTPYFASVATDTSVVRSFDNAIEGVFTGIFDFAGNNGTGFCWKPARCEVRPDIAAAYSNRGATAKTGIDWVAADYDTAFEDVRNFIWDVTWTTSGAKSIDLDFCSAAHIFVRITNQVSGAYLWEVLNGGLFLGQKLSVMNRDASTQTFEIRANSPGGLALGSAGEFLSNSRGMTFMWEPGSPGKWRPITE